MLTGLVEQDAAVRLWLVTDAAAPADFAAATAEATRAIIDDAMMGVHRDGPTIDGLSPLITWLAKILPAPSAERASAGRREWLHLARVVISKRL